MTSVVLFHHPPGLTDGVRRSAVRLSAAGHEVALPDLYDGATFATLDESIAPAQKVAQTRPGARGALLLFSAVPAAQEPPGTVDDAQLHLYPGSGHLVADDC